MENKYYSKLCAIVYDLTKPNPPAEQYNFYRKYAIEADGPVLEPMCGTGRFLIPLLNATIDIYGFDASEDMCEALYKKSALAQDRVWHGLINDQSSYRRNDYKLIMIPAGSFSLIADIETVSASLKCIYNGLDDDGIFFVELDNQSDMMKFSESTYNLDSEMSIKMTSISELDDEITSVRCVYELMKNGTIIDTEIEKYHLRIYKENKFEAFLDTAGFAEIKKIERHETIIYQCKK